MELFYRMRQRFQPEGREYREPNLPADIAGLAPEIKDLLNRYPTLLPRVTRFSRPSLEKTLGHLDLLDRLGGNRLELKAGRILDVGSADWSYAGAIVSWLKERTPVRPLDILGIEVDPHRFDSAFVTAASKARHQIQTFTSKGIHLDYQGGCFTQVFGLFDLITWFFPVFSTTQEPAAQLGHANRILDQGGYVLFASSGFGEWESLREKIVSLDLPWRLERVAEAREHLHASKSPVYVSLWSKS